MEIPVEIVGTILNSQHVGHQVRVSDDSENTGGFLIFEWWQGSDGPNAGNAFDSWVKNREDLAGFFQESGWEVKWSK
jgi:hypothetical protein